MEFKPMECVVLSCVPEVFKGKGGQSDSLFYRVYMADAVGHIGYIYTNAEYPAGVVAKVGFKEREGRLKLAVLGV